MEDFIVNKLFNSLSDSQRKDLLEKIIEDSMLPEKLRDPDTNYSACAFHILMTRSKLDHKWADLNSIINTLKINNITEEEANITLYVITKYITEI